MLMPTFAGSCARGGKASAQRGHTLMRLGRYDEAVSQFESLMRRPESEGDEECARSPTGASKGTSRSLTGPMVCRYAPATALSRTWAATA